jgi:hypothetical protein
MTQLATKKQHKFGHFLFFFYMFDKSLAVSAPWENWVGQTSVHVWKVFLHLLQLEAAQENFVSI